MKMNPNSLFAILLRSPWWASFLVAFGIGAVARLLLPESLLPYAWFFALPFAAVGCAAAWQQWRAPSGEQVSRTLEELRAMTGEDFTARLEAAFRDQGHAVRRIDAPGADLELERDGRTTLVASRRWKAARTGIEPLRELAALREAREAREGIYVCLGEPSANALAFARTGNIRLLQGPELAGLLSAAPAKRS